MAVLALEDFIENDFIGEDSRDSQHSKKENRREKSFSERKPPIEFKLSHWEDNASRDLLAYDLNQGYFNLEELLEWKISNDNPIHEFRDTGRNFYKWENRIKLASAMLKEISEDHFGSEHYFDAMKSYFSSVEKGKLGRKIKESKALIIEYETTQKEIAILQEQLKSADVNKEAIIQEIGDKKSLMPSEKRYKDRVDFINSIKEMQRYITPPKTEPNKSLEMRAVRNKLKKSQVGLSTTQYQPYTPLPEDKVIEPKKTLDIKDYVSMDLFEFTEDSLLRLYNPIKKKIINPLDKKLGISNKKERLFQSLNDAYNLFIYGEKNHIKNVGNLKYISIEDAFCHPIEAFNDIYAVRKTKERLKNLFSKK